MYKHKSRYLLAFFLMSITLSNAVFAKNLTTDLNWLLQHIKKHPQVMAAKEVMNAQMYRAENLTMAIYNPEISGDFGKEGSDRTYTLGINQTIDRSNKRGDRKQQAQYKRMAAQSNYGVIIQAKMAQALSVLINWQALEKQSTLVSQQEKQLENLLVIVEKRSRSGDLGQVDTELTYLSLSQKFGETAKVQAQLRRIEAKIRELLPDWNQQTILLPDEYWQSVVNTTTDDLLENHPLVLLAKAQWEIALLDAELAKKNKKADPTIGLEAGKLSNDNVLSLSFSMPLNVRNNFSLGYKAANQQAIAAESQFYGVRRQQKFSIEASQAALKEYRTRQQKWQNLMQGRSKNSEELLQKQWNVGDISTTEYLLTLQQRTQGLIAGIELQQEYQLSFVQLLLDAAQLNPKQATRTEIQQ